MTGFRFSFLGVVMAAALGLVATGASADGPVYRGSIKGEPPPAPVYVWSGLYIGGGVEYGFGATEVVGLIEGESFELLDLILSGARGVVAVGYDWQLSPKWVLGVFGDYAFGDIDGTLGDFTSVIEQQWAIGGRLSLLATPSTLFYASGGYTRANHEVDISGLDRLPSKTLDGFFVGLGVEQAFNRKLSLKVDYRFSDYEDFTPIIEGIGPLSLNFDNAVHSVRIGVNWRFGG